MRFGRIAPRFRGIGWLAAIASIVIVLILVFGVYFSYADFAGKPSAQPPKGYPNLASNVAPNPKPKFPAGFDVFNPPVGTAVPSSSAAFIAQMTPTGGQDESLAIAGYQLSSFNGSDAGKDTAFTAFAQTSPSNARTAKLKILRLDGDTASVTLDSGQPSWGMYLVWPENSSGYGYPVAINKTQVWWVGPEAATRGETVSLYGRNLSHDNGTSKAWIYIQPANRTGRWATVKAVNPYKVDFTVPSDLPNGTYRLWAHNGHGGNYGWSAPAILTVNDGMRRSGVVINAKQHGVKGDGVTDDAPAIKSLVKTYSGSGATLRFPAGTYMLGSQVGDFSKLSIVGDGMKATTLRAMTGFQPGGMLIAGGAFADLEIKDLTIDSNGQNLARLVFVRDSRDVRFTNVRFLGPGVSTFDMHAARRISVKNSQVIGTDSFLGTGSQLFFDRVDFYGTADANTFLYSWGGKEISLTNSTAQDFNNQDTKSGAGWAQGRFYTGTALWGTQSNIYIGNNKTFQLGVRPGFGNQNTGEQFMWEGCNTTFIGSPTSVTPTTLTIKNLTYADKELRVVVVKGKGLGQWRRIAAYDAATKTITVDRPWNVTPDTSSTIALALTVENVVVYKNNLDFKPRGMIFSNYIASSGVQFFEGALGTIVDSNIFQRPRMAISLWNYGDTAVKPLFFNLITGNVVKTASQGVYLDVKKSPLGITNTIGQVIRNNSFDNLTDTGFYWGAGPGVTEHNIVTNAAKGSRGISTGTSYDVLYKNTFQRGSAPGIQSYALGFDPSSVPSLRENSISGYENTFSGNGQPGGRLEVPFRTLEILAPIRGEQSKNISLWNVGTASLSWSSAADVNWLKLSPTRGAIPDQKSTANVKVSCDARSLSAGSYAGTITVTSKSQTKKVSVKCMVR
jgi:hypothetical protein